MLDQAFTEKVTADAPIKDEEIEIIKARDQVVYRALFELEISNMTSQTQLEIQVQGLACYEVINIEAEFDQEHIVPELIKKQASKEPVKKVELNQSDSKS